MWLPLLMLPWQHNDDHMFFPPLQTHCSYRHLLQLPRFIYVRWIKSFLFIWPLHGVIEGRWLRDFVDGQTAKPSLLKWTCWDSREGRSNTSADLPTDASGFTAWWLNCEGERWFACLLWYFHCWQEQHTTLRRPRRYRHRRCQHHPTEGINL